MAPPDPPFWCRLEVEGERIRRVNVMHASGEILASWPPEIFDAGLLARMRAGEIRAAVLDDPDGGKAIALRDGAGHLVFSESLSRPSARRDESR